MGRPAKNTQQKPAKEKLLEAAFAQIRRQGYSATTVDDLCREAGVTKGTFFHYFESKEALAVAAAEHWSRVTGKFFENAPFHQAKDPLDRVLGYVDFRKEILQGELPQFTCLIGTMVQEAYETNPEIRKACKDSIFGHAETLESDIRAAKTARCPRAKWEPRSLANHTQAVIQGAFILAKASGSAEIAAESLDHLKNYILLLFSNPGEQA